MLTRITRLKLDLQHHSSSSPVATLLWVNSLFVGLMRSL